MKLLEFFVKDYLAHNNFLGEDFFFNENFTHTMDDEEIAFLKEQLIAAKAALDSYYESYKINDIEFSHSNLRLYTKDMIVYDEKYLRSIGASFSIHDLFECNTRFPAGLVDAVLSVRFAGTVRHKAPENLKSMNTRFLIGTRHNECLTIEIVLKDWRAV